MSEERHELEGRTTEDRPSTLILGVGNILLSDEGIGVRVIEAMKDRDLPPDVELLDGGTASLELLNIMANRDKVIVIDAVEGGGEPGTIYRFTPDDIKYQSMTFTSLHQISLLETLTDAKYLGIAPKTIVILGIEPKELGLGLDITPEVAAVIPRVVELVMAEIGTR
ncbi:MAG TPA: hydrogenase maturation protease [Dehalococcoidia bacterium]|nr:hydrogenase maturation protease [Dehalococcoidia bacterium]